MQKIALLTDSSCDLREDVRRENNIEMLPFRIIFEDKEYLDKITITPEELYEALKEEVPTTSLPDLEYSTNLIERLKEEGYTDVVVVTVSSRLSGTLNSIKLLVEDHNEIKFHFFDSKTLGFPVGALALEGASLIKKGLSAEQVVDKLHERKTKLHAFVTLNTLEYLRKGGRIGRVAGAVGEILHLKPIIAASDEGDLYAFGKVRGRKQSISKLKALINERLEKAKCKVWVLQGAAQEEANALLESIKSHKNIAEISLETIGASMGVHTGPGAVGVCMIEVE